MEQRYDFLIGDKLNRFINFFIYILYIFKASVAQLVVQMTCNHPAAGSSPVSGIEVSLWSKLN